MMLEVELKKWHFPVQEYVFEEGKVFAFNESEDLRLFLHSSKFLLIVPSHIIEYTRAYT
jgi:hypothetical protein